MINDFRKAQIQKISLAFSDIFALLSCYLVARGILNFINPNVGHITFKSVGVSKFGGLILIAVFWYQEQYSKRRPTWEEIGLITKTIFIFAILHMGFSFLISHHVVKTFNILFWFSLFFILPVFRNLSKVILCYFGLWKRNVYIVGTGKTAINAVDLLSNNNLLGYKVVGLVTFDSNNHNENTLDLPIINYESLLDNSYTENDTEIVVALNSGEIISHIRQINVLQSHYTFVSILPDIRGLPLYGAEVEHFFGNDQLFLRLQNNLSRRLNRMIKRATDMVLALIAIVMLSPFLALIGLFIVASTKSGVIYKHKRVGRNGDFFYCLKFKTMYSNSQEVLNQLLANNHEARLEWEKDFKLKNDPRVTPIGKFLRKSSLDELPQLFNVLLGDMSLVGPRPIVEDEINKYKDDFYYYKLVSPGITGLWQISGRNDIDYNNRVRLDVCYIKNWSLWYDFVILLKTIQVVIKRSGAY